MAELTAQIDMTQWKHMLEGIQARAKNVAGILKAVFNTFGFKDIVDHFEKEQGEDGAKWAPRSAETQAWYTAIMQGRRKPPRGTARAAYNPSNRLLQLTGRMRQSIGPTNVRRLTDKSILIFANMEYSGRHQSGGKGLPRRSFMWVSDGALNDMAEASVSLLLRKDGI